MDQSPKKILLVEDEDFIRQLYERELTKAGFVVKSAPDGTTGLNMLMSETFHLLLLDIMLPGMNGLQLLRDFKTKNPNTNTIVVLLTNLGQEAVIKEGFELGAQAYLIKASYSPQQIVTEVKNALAGQPAGGPPPSGTSNNPPGTPPTGTPPLGTPPTSSAPPTGTPPGTPPSTPPAA